MPYTAAREQHEIVIRLKGIDTNATDSLAYNYFIPNQNLKNFLRYVTTNDSSSTDSLLLLLLFHSDRTESVCWRLWRRLSTEEVLVRRSNESFRTAHSGFTNAEVQSHSIRIRSCHVHERLYRRVD
jgi:hypothetical protein